MYVRLSRLLRCAKLGSTPSVKRTLLHRIVVRRNVAENWRTFVIRDTFIMFYCNTSIVCVNLYKNVCYSVLYCVQLLYEFINSKIDDVFGA